MIPESASPGRNDRSRRPRAWNPEHAPRVWELARSRALRRADLDVCEFLADSGLALLAGQPGLAPFGTFGGLAEFSGIRLLRSGLYPWIASSHRLALALHETRNGDLTVVQGIAIDRRAKQAALNPCRSRVAGTAMATDDALGILRGLASTTTVMVAEGWLDFLSLASATSLPTLGAPGPRLAASLAGPWARGRLVGLFVPDGCYETPARAFRAIGARVVRLRPGGFAVPHLALRSLGRRALGDALLDEIYREGGAA